MSGPKSITDVTTVDEKGINTPARKRDYIRVDALAATAEVVESTTPQKSMEWEALCTPSAKMDRLLTTIESAEMPLAQKQALLTSIGQAVDQRDATSIDAAMEKIGEELDGVIWDYRLIQEVPAKDFNAEGAVIPSNEEVAHQCLRFRPQGKAIEQVRQAIESLSEQEEDTFLRNLGDARYWLDEREATAARRAEWVANSKTAAAPIELPETPGLVIEAKGALNGNGAEKPAHLPVEPKAGSTLGNGAQVQI